MQNLTIRNILVTPFVIFRLLVLWPLGLLINWLEALYEVLYDVVPTWKKRPFSGE